MIRVTIAAKLIPQTGAPGDIWIPKDCRRVFVVGDNSIVIDVTAALDGGLFRGLSVALIEEVCQLQTSVAEFIALNARAKDYIQYLKSKRSSKQ
jgi:hypothetical protein